VSPRDDQQADSSDGSSVDDAAPNDDDPTPVTTVDGVVHSFGPVDVLDGVSLEVEPGSVVAVVGPNGSGKTTLLRIVAGLLAQDAGEVSRSGKTRRPVGYLPQEPAFNPAFTVAETVQFYADLLGPYRRGEDALERVGLEALSDRRVDALSGGMRRLLGLAVATLGDPPLVVLDEPTGDLDPRMTDHIFGLVGDLAADGTGVLLATHDLAGAAGSDRVLVLDEGGLVAQGSPADLLEEAGADSLDGAFRSLVGEDVAPRAGVDR
jgi:ABC-type multidrug transport system ATPase subunit